MRIVNNKEINNKNNIIANISRHKETSDKINKSMKQIPT